MRRYSFFILVLGICFSSLAQNSLRLLSANGHVFTVKIKNELVNPQAQSSLLIGPVLEDSLNVFIEFENGIQLQSPVYLLDKGKTCAGKEFNYRLDVSAKQAKLVFLGIYDLKALPDPLVPAKPMRDTMPAYRNRFMGHLCELKNGEPTFFNNLPKEGKCVENMPDAYLDFARVLVKSAQVEERKIARIEAICRNNCLSVSQFSTLSGYVTYEIEKLKLLKIAYFNFTDPEHTSQLESSFRFGASITELNNFLKNPGEYAPPSGGNCPSASDTVEIQKLKSQLLIYPSDSERYIALKKTYTSYCYSLSQVGEIMALFIHDREKTDAAKLLYFYCTEKEKYLQLLNLFSYNESKNGFRNFVEKQGK